MRTILLVLCVVVAGCASNSASIEKTWRAPDARPGELGAVTTMFVSDDMALRRESEDRMAAALQARGIRAVPSYALLGATPIDRDAAVVKMRMAQLDGVVMMRIVNKGKKTKAVSTSFRGAFGMLWTQTRLVPETVVQVETTAYSLRTNRMLWTSLSKSASPEAVAKMIGDVTQVVTAELDKQGLLSV